MQNYAQRVPIKDRERLQKNTPKVSVENVNPELYARFRTMRVEEHREKRKKDHTLGRRPCTGHELGHVVEAYIRGVLGE